MKGNKQLRQTFASIAAALTVLLGGSTVSIASVSQDVSRIMIPEAPITGPVRPITLDDIVSLREVHEPRRSPDGRFVAYIVKQAFRDCNCNRSALYVIDAAAKTKPRKLLEEDSISGIDWTPDSKYISYLSGKSGTIQLWRIDPGNPVPQQVFTHDAAAMTAFDTSAAMAVASGILGYHWSHDGKTIAFAANSVIPASETAGLVRKGVLYDDVKMFSLDVQYGDWAAARRSVQLWLYHMDNQREEKVFDAPAGALSSIGGFSWSNDDRNIAVAYNAPDPKRESGFDDQGVGILNVANRRFQKLGTFPGSVQEPAWSPDNRSLAIMYTPEASAAALEAIHLPDGTRTHVIWGILGGSVHWDTQGQNVIFGSSGLGMDRENTGIYTVNLATRQVRRITPNRYSASDCDHPLHGTMVCVWQSPTLAPSPALVDLQSGQATPLANINPELRMIALANVRELHWKNEYGEETNGYLLLPSRKVSNARIPLAIMAYGFNGDFVTQAASAETSYPAQMLVRDGIAVLLVNPPVQLHTWVGPNFQLGSRAWGYGPLSSLKTIIHQLVTHDSIDPKHIGFMGHSWGGFWVEFAITHSNLLAAVELHNGGTLSEPGTYWEIGNLFWRRDMEHYLGGPPYGSTFKNYVAFSATLNAGNIRTPVLMDYDAGEPEFEMYAALRSFHVPVDYVIYPGDGHVFFQPDHRYYSMQRNVDWFRFWLQGYEDPAPEKREQYRRWEGFRVQRDALLKEPIPREP